MSLRRRLFVAVVLASALASSLLGWRLTSELRLRFAEASEESLVDTAEILAAVVSRASTGAVPAVDALKAAWADARARPVHATIYSLSKADLGVGVSITDRNGIVLWDSDRPQDVGRDNSHWLDVARTLSGSYGARATRSDPGDPSTAVLHIAAPVRRAGVLLGVPSMLSTPVEHGAERILRAAQLQTLIICTFPALLGGLSAALATIWITRPISQLSDWVAAARAGRRTPAPVGGPSEVAALSQAFSALADELEGRRYVEVWAQQLVHEMKAPIAGLRAAAELLSSELPIADRERLLANLREGSERLAAMLDRLLLLASVERLRQVEHSVPCDPPQRLAQEAVESLRALAEPARGSSSKCRARARPPVKGDPFQLRQAVQNLVLNALEFSSDRGAIAVEIESRQGQAHLRVLDRGPGIDPGIRPRLFERFAQHGAAQWPQGHRSRACPGQGGRPPSPGIGHPR